MSLLGKVNSQKPAYTFFLTPSLAASRWIANGENVLLLGPPGVGKTHLSIALGREAILAGYTVQFTTATTLVAGLAKAHGERRLD